MSASMRRRNRLTTLPVDALTLPTRIYGKEIGDDIEALRSGKEIFVEDIHLKDGRVISGHARVDANRGDVVFRNDNNPHLRIHDTVFGVKVSADIQAKLANHEVVFIPGMKVGGKTISTDLRYSDTGRPLFGNNARNYRSRLGEENPRPRQRVRPASSVTSRGTTQRHEDRIAAMKRIPTEKELPYFTATLTAYLRESHPELLPDKHFIAERSDHAAQTYERAVRNGQQRLRGTGTLERRFIPGLALLEIRCDLRGRIGMVPGGRSPGSAPLSA